MTPSFQIPIPQSQLLMVLHIHSLSPKHISHTTVTHVYKAMNCKITTKEMINITLLCHTFMTTKQHPFSIHIPMDSFKTDNK